MISVEVWKSKCKKKGSVQEITFMRFWNTLRLSNTFGASHLNYCKYHRLMLAASSASECRQKGARCLQRLIQQVASVKGRMQNLSFDVQPSETARWDWVAKLHSKTGFLIFFSHCIFLFCRKLNLFLLKMFNVSY